MSIKLQQYILAAIFIGGLILALASVINPELNELLKSITL